MKKHAAILSILLLLPFWLFAQNQETGDDPGVNPAVDRETGQVNSAPLWRQALGGSITTLPTVQVESVVMILDSGAVKAYSSAGTPLWTYFARGRLSPFVSRSREGTSYICRNTGVLIAVNRSGRELWRKNLGDPQKGGTLSGPVIPGWDGRVFVPTEKKIFCYTAAGKLLWTKEFAHNIGISPRLDTNGGILLALENDELIRIDPFGRIVSRTLTSPAAALVSLSGGRLLVLYKNARLGLWTPGASEEKLLPQLPAPPLAAVARYNNIAVCLADGRVIVISDEGKILWTGESHISIKRKNSGGADTLVSMIYDERGVYALSPSGASGFNAEGKRLWFTVLDNAAAMPAFGDDGILYTGGRDWILYAYKLETRYRKEKQSLYGPAPQGSYGMDAPPPSPWANYHFRFDDTELSRQLGIYASLIESGTLGERETELVAYLMEVASGEYGRVATLAPVQYRVKALQLLAHIASRETIPYLVEIFVHDKEPTVRAAAAEAIGAAGIDPDGIAIKAFLNAIPPAITAKDDQVLNSIASATGALCRFSGPPLSDTGVKILTLISLGYQTSAAQKRALRELESLKM